MPAACRSSRTQTARAKRLPTPRPKAQAQPIPDAVEYARTHASHALVVWRDGRIDVQEYGGGYDGEKPHALYSGTKSFWGVAAVSAARDGIISLDERVADIFPEWQADERKRRVTLRQLLNLTSGYAFGGLGAAVPPYAKALGLPLASEPGTRFTYGGIPLQVFGAAFARKLAPLGQTPHEYLRARILDPIGLRIGSWRTLSDGTHPLPTGAFVAALEWLKYGIFVCEHRDEYAECFAGSAANPRYGLGFWLSGAVGPPDLAYASGSGGQAMYIVPSERTVVVHFGGSSSYKHDAFLKRFFPRQRALI